MTDPATAATFAATFAALYIGHTVGDHWVQTDHQADTKSWAGRTGRLSCARHVLTLTLTKVVLLVPIVLVLGLPVGALGLTLGLGLDAASHYWADRRTTLRRLAYRLGRDEMYILGTPEHPAHPVADEGDWAPTLGTGAYAMDQSWHILWLGIAALIIAAI
ncbi:transcriptional regulator [Streptomyces albidoflavus]|uniref:transcriptional regulator n=1 Tax=Streptomyces albidoflavus TaxID=1886 RepID=UPI0033BEC03B